MAVYDPSVDDQIRDLYEFHSAEEVARIVGCGRWMVLSHIRRMGLEVKPRGTPGWRSQRLSPKELERTREAWNRLGSYEAVARELGGISRGAVAGRVKRYGFSKPPKARRRDTLYVNIAPVVPIIVESCRIGASSWDDRDLERMRIHAQKPTVADLAIQVGVDETLIGGLVSGDQTRTSLENVEKILLALGAHGRLYELYPELQGESSEVA